ncbi:hypothetical protein [Paraburkholderia caribensis]|uniref:hypothetical protein n=1 Tax=Paraburkholderia caribensis TaxID=75105 RepID=UPI0031D8457F
MENWRNLLGVFARSERLYAAASDVVVDYGEDVPPTVLYGGLGRTLAREFTSLSTPEKVQIFDAIEEALNSEEVRQVELVATGLLEGLFNASVKLSCWEQIKPFLGIRSRTYLSAWTSWT